MFAARQLTRTAPRFAAQLRTPMQRRFASTAENEFISERQHIKEHAQGTTGEYPCPIAPCPASNRTCRALEEDFSLVCPPPVLDVASFCAVFAPYEGQSSRLRRICLDGVVQG